MFKKSLITLLIGMLIQIGRPLTCEAKVKNIIFDFGAVILDLDFNRFRAELEKVGVHHLKDGTEESQKLAHLSEQFSLGAMKASEFRQKVQQLTDRPALSDEKFDAAYSSLQIGFVPERIEFLKSIRRHYKIFLLSSNNEIHYQDAQRLYQRDLGEPFAAFNQLFLKVYYSHLVGLSKSRSSSYDQILKENALKFEETLFVDDYPPFLKAAKLARLHTFQVTRKRSILDIPEYIKALDSGTPDQEFTPWDFLPGPEPSQSGVTAASDRR